VAPVWFAPKDRETGRGGLRPVTWQGWFASVAFIVLLAAVALLGPKGLPIALLVTLAYLGLIALTRSPRG